jgi:uracil phosphoribosyltransferase
MDLSQYPNATLLNHPLLKHKITLLRDKNTPTSVFRPLVKEIAMLEGYEVLKTCRPSRSRSKPRSKKPPSRPSAARRSALSRSCGRAWAWSMASSPCLPTAHCGHIGLYRNEVTHQPVEYYCKLPAGLADMNVYLLDPMLATGGSGIDAVKILKKHGAKNITFVCIIAAPEGVKPSAKRIRTSRSTSAPWTAASTKTPTSARVSGMQAIESSAPSAEPSNSLSSSISSSERLHFFFRSGNIDVRGVALKAIVVKP